jgi:hypothetical protein
MLVVVLCCSSIREPGTVRLLLQRVAQGSTYQRLVAPNGRAFAVAMQHRGGAAEAQT